MVVMVLFCYRVRQLIRELRLMRPYPAQKLPSLEVQVKEGYDEVFFHRNGGPIVMAER
jgi:hypothetical protein